MSDSESLCREVYAAIERGARRVLASQSIVVKADESGKVAVSGELEDIVTKRKVVLAAASVTGVRELEDHTRLIPSESRADGEILDSLYQAMSSESVFRDYAIAGEDGGPNGARYSNPRDASGVVEILVKDAVATLVGHV
jgi:hypothetical protein